MFPLRHRQCVIARQQTAPHEEPQQAPAHLRLHRGDGWRIDPAGGVEDDPARRGRVEHAVDDDAMEVQVGIEPSSRSDGWRPLGIAALEDKIVQRAVVEVLNAIYEAGLLGILIRVPAWAWAT